jgi:hypothetical protein
MARPKFVDLLLRAWKILLNLVLDWVVFVQGAVWCDQRPLGRALDIMDMDGDLSEQE